jgi:hypothetical protein
MTDTGDMSPQGDSGDAELDLGGGDEPETDLGDGDGGDEPEQDLGADLAAELDEEPDAEFLDDEDGTDGDPLPVYQGVCAGGPWDGRPAATRYPKGFLLVDKPGMQVWIYDRDETSGNFTARTPNPQALLEDGPVNRWRAAEEPHYDLLAVGGVAGDDGGDDDFVDDGSTDCEGA